MSTPEPVSPSPATSKWEGAIVLVVALACIVFQLWVPTTRVADADYQALAQVLSAEAQPGDVVLLAPWWTERARLFVPDGLLVVGYLGSEADDLTRFSRVWVLAEPDLPRAGMSEFMRAFGPQRTEVGSERRFGHLSLRLFTNGRSKPVRFSADTWLSRAKVYLEEPNGRRDCVWNGRVHVCPNNHAVAVERHEVRFQPLQCVTFDAPGGPTKLVLELNDVPAADELVLRSGLVWERAAYVDGVTDCHVGLEVNGAKQTLEVPKGVEKLHVLSTANVPQGSTVRLTLQSDNPNARLLCMDLVGYGGAK